MLPFLKKLRGIDAFWMSCFTILITLQPYYRYGEINVFEFGLYLPGIDAILNGLVPFRDFFHLRGPMELYMPALIMSIFGEKLSVLSLYFYVGNVLTLIVFVLIAREIYQTRLIFYLAIPVMIARAFPRVVFSYWGGMRYAWGALAVWCMIRFFRQGKWYWMALAGFLSGLAFFTSVEIGVCSLAAALGTLTAAFLFKIQDQRTVLKNLGFYILGFSFLVVPYVFYLMVNGALLPYLEAGYTVVTKMEDIINLHFISVMPSTFFEAVRGMLNPLSTNFKQLTPGYCYLALLVYLGFRIHKRKIARSDLNIICLGFYGFVMYAAAFRAIWASQFEMALQPEKIILFFIFEVVLLRALQRKEEFSAVYLKRAVSVMVLLLTLGSIGYAIQRFNHRFFIFKFVVASLTGQDTKSLRPLPEVAKRQANVRRAGSLMMPLAQADELERLTAFIQQKTSSQEPVFMFPELGTYQFLVERPFIGRFPMVTFAWFQDHWHREMVEDLKKAKPRFAVMTTDMGPWFTEVYFRIPENKAKFDEIDRYIKEHYKFVRDIGSVAVYERR